VNGSTPESPVRISGTTSRGQSRCAVRGLFPLTPALSLGERVNPSPRGEQSRSLGFSLPNARYSLSLGERVRGNCADYPLEHRTIPGTVELDESPGGA